MSYGSPRNRILGNCSRDKYPDSGVAYAILLADTQNSQHVARTPLARVHETYNPYPMHLFFKAQMHYLKSKPSILLICFLKLTANYRL